MSIISLTKEDIRSIATWPLCIEAIRDGHRRPKAQVGDTFVGANGNTMLVRSAWIDGLAAGVKAATVVPGNPSRNPPLPSVHAQVMLFDTENGQLTALLDGTEITAWKTAADSALGCDILARRDAKTLLMVGAGAMAEPLIRAHRTVRPSIDTILIWNRTRTHAEALAERLSDLPVTVADHLEDAVAGADIISCATMAKDPILPGAALRPGTHVDLVGAFKADMREADDDVHRRGHWFVDSYDTTLGHIGEIDIPIANGLITRDALRGDLHAMVAGEAGRLSDDAITVFKNGGGAHLDIIVSAAIAEAFKARG